MHWIVCEFPTMPWWLDASSFAVGEVYCPLISLWGSCRYNLFKIIPKAYIYVYLQDRRLNIFFFKYQCSHDCTFSASHLKSAFPVYKTRNLGNDYLVRHGREVQVPFLRHSNTWSMISWRKEDTRIRGLCGVLASLYDPFQFLFWFSFIPSRISVSGD